MSYILEALRKSEAERARGEPPDLGTVHQTPARRRRPGSALAFLAGVLLVNAALFGYWLLQPTPAARGVDPGAAPAARPRSQAEPGGRAGTEPVRSDDVATSAPATEIPTATSAVPNASQARAEASAAAPQAAADTRGSEPVDLDALPEALRARLPRLRISTHIYSEDPSLREVTINGRRFVPGDHVGDGLRLERITADGVVLALDGRHFRMTVLEEWGY